MASTGYSRQRRLIVTRVKNVPRLKMKPIELTAKNCSNLRRGVVEVPERPEAVDRPVDGGGDHEAAGAGDVEPGEAFDRIHRRRVPDEAERTDDAEADEVVAEARAGQ